MGPQNVKILGPWGPQNGGALFSHDTGSIFHVRITLFRKNCSGGTGIPAIPIRPERFFLIEQFFRDITVGTCMQLPFSLPGPSVALVGPRPYQAQAWLRHCTLGLFIYNNLTLPSGYALTHAHDASSYTSHLMWYTLFWSPLGIQESTDQNQFANKSSFIYDL